VVSLRQMDVEEHGREEDVIAWALIALIIIRTAARDFSVHILRLCIQFDFFCATSIQDIYDT
jgi:hypothetical protein